MKKNLFYVMSLAAVFSLGSCSQEELMDAKQDDIVTLGIGDISSRNINSRGTGVIEGESLPQGAEMGLFFVEDGKTTYYDKEYHNVKCTQTAVSTSSQTWDVGKNIVLKDIDGYAYLYYPYNSSATDITEIPVDNSNADLDFMYSIVMSWGVDCYNATKPSIQTTLFHLCSWIQLVIKKGTYNGDCDLTEIAINNIAGSKGTFNLIDEVFTLADGELPMFVETKNWGNFKNDDLIIDLLVIPDSSKNAYIGFFVDNYEWNGNTSTTKWIAGKKYTYNITMNLANSAEIAQISVSDWSNGGTENWTDHNYVGNY